MTKKYSISDVDDYSKKLNNEQKKLLVIHCNKNNISPEVCAWYENREDFYSDWFGVGYSKEDVRSLLKTNDGGEFKVFQDGSIVRLVK